MKIDSFVGHCLSRADPNRCISVLHIRHELELRLLETRLEYDITSGMVLTLPAAAAIIMSFTVGSLHVRAFRSKKSFPLSHRTTAIPSYRVASVTRSLKKLVDVRTDFAVLVK